MLVQDYWPDKSNVYVAKKFIHPTQKLPTWYYCSPALRSYSVTHPNLHDHPFKDVYLLTSLSFSSQNLLIWGTIWNVSWPLVHHTSKLHPTYLIIQAHPQPPYPIPTCPKLPIHPKLPTQTSQRCLLTASLSVSRHNLFIRGTMECFMAT